MLTASTGAQLRAFSELNSGPSRSCGLCIRDVFQMNVVPVSLVCDPLRISALVTSCAISCPGLDHHKSMKLIFQCFVFNILVTLLIYIMFRTFIFEKDVANNTEL